MPNPKRTADKHWNVWFRNIDGSRNRFWMSYRVIKGRRGWDEDDHSKDLERIQTFSDRELEYLSNFADSGRRLGDAIEKCASFFRGIDAMPDPFHVGPIFKRKNAWMEKSGAGCKGANQVSLSGDNRRFIEQIKSAQTAKDGKPLRIWFCEKCSALHWK